MNKILLILLLLASSPGWSITPAESELAKVKMRELYQLVLEGVVYTSQVDAMVDGGFNATISGSTETVPIPQAVQDRIVTKYQAIKAGLVTKFNQLP